MKMFIGLVGLVVLLATSGCQSESASRYQGGYYSGFTGEYPDYEIASKYSRHQGGYYGGFRAEYSDYRWNSPAAGNHYWHGF